MRCRTRHRRKDNMQFLVWHGSQNLCQTRNAIQYHMQEKNRSPLRDRIKACEKVSISVWGRGGRGLAMLNLLRIEIFAQLLFLVFRSQQKGNSNQHLLYCRDRPAAIPVEVKSIDDTSNFDEFPDVDLHWSMYSSCYFQLLFFIFDAFA